MRADLSRDPDELDRIARVLRDLAAGLSTGRIGTPAGPAAGSALDEHAAAARRIVDELDAAATAVDRAAASGRDADAEAAAGFREPEPGPLPGGPAEPVPGSSGGGSPADPLTR